MNWVLGLILVLSLILAGGQLHVPVLIFFLIHNSSSEKIYIKILNGQSSSRTKNYNPPKIGTSQHWYKAPLRSHLFSYPPTYI
jgi:hypothetical protein